MSRAVLYIPPVDRDLRTSTSYGMLTIPVTSLVTDLLRGVGWRPVPGQDGAWWTSSRAVVQAGCGVLAAVGGLLGGRPRLVTPLSLVALVDIPPIVDVEVV